MLYKKKKTRSLKLQTRCNQKTHTKRAFPMVLCRPTNGVVSANQWFRVGTNGSGSTNSFGSEGETDGYVSTNRQVSVNGAAKTNGFVSKPNGFVSGAQWVRVGTVFRPMVLQIRRFPNGFGSGPNRFVSSTNGVVSVCALQWFCVDPHL